MPKKQRECMDEIVMVMPDGCAGKEEERSFGKLCDIVGPSHNLHDFF